LVARILETQGDGETALEAYEQSSNLYAKAVKLNAAIDAHQLGLGNSLARVGFLKNDHDKLEAAVEVLSDVVATNPFESAYQITLANVFGTLARNQRDGGHPNNAIKLEQEAISILQPIIRKNPAAAPNDLLFSYSSRLAHLAELLGDAGDFDDSRTPLGESIRVLEKICQSEGARPEHRRALARSRGLVGFACLKIGNKNEAKEHLELAKAQWESFVAENPKDEVAEQAVRWTTDQLRGLQ
jgi:tetratricopeptide (TPR) repeat protein